MPLDRVPHERQWGEFFALAKEGLAYASRGFSHGGGSYSSAGEYTSGHVGGVQATEGNYSAPAVKEDTKREGYADL